MDKKLELEIERMKVSGENWLNNFPAYISENCGYELKSSSFSDRKIWKNASGRSKLKKGKTIKEFFQDCREAIEAAGISNEEVERLPKGTYTGDVALEEFVEYLLPAYVILRERGYNHTDLTA